MTVFTIGYRSALVPGSMRPIKKTRQEDAWLDGEYVTIEIEKALKGLRVHTNGRAFSAADVIGEREATKLIGAWAAVGDVDMTSSELVDYYALPGPFTHIAEVLVPVGCIVNFGFNGPVCFVSHGPTRRRPGGGIQIEWVAGPEFEFTRIDKVWMNRTASA